VADPFKLKPPKKFKLRSWKPRETHLQAALFDWVKWEVARRPELYLIYAVPNGAVAGPGRFATVNWMKSQGMKNGVPDVCLPVPRGGFCALYIEMKTESGELTDEQDKFIAVLRHYGNKVVVCRSSESAIAEITEYLDDRDPPSARPGA
jgi:hypothetical protein